MSLSILARVFQATNRAKPVSPERACVSIESSDVIDPQPHRRQQQRPIRETVSVAEQPNALRSLGQTEEPYLRDEGSPAVGSIREIP